MAYGKKTGGRDIKEGEVLNPNGRPKLPDDIKEARKLNKLEFERIVNKYLYMKKEEITEALRDPDTPAIEMAVAQLIVKGITLGDPVRLNFLLERLLGKVKFVHEHSNPDGTLGVGKVVILPSNGRETNE
jgi:hypothetical protein